MVWEQIQLNDLTWNLAEFHDLNGRLSVVLILEGYVFVVRCTIEGHLLCQKDFESRPFDTEIVPWSDQIELMFDEGVQEEIYKQARGL